MEHRGRPGWPGLMTLLVLVVPMTAAGQEAPVEDEPAEVQAPAVVKPWSSGHYWRSTSLTGEPMVHCGRMPVP